LLEAYRERDRLDWTSPKLAMIDLQYHDVRPGKGLYQRLVETGKIERLVSDQEVELATQQPPETTRAYFRGRCIQRYRDQIAAASWDSLIFDAGSDALQRVPTREPLRGTREHVEALLDGAETAADLIDALQR
jgi:proteasome accessory factor A